MKEIMKLIAKVKKKEITRSIFNRFLKTSCLNIRYHLLYEYMTPFDIIVKITTSWKTISLFSLSSVFKINIKK